MPDRPLRIHRLVTPRRRSGAARRPRGSVLVVALLVAALIALVLGGYLSLNLGSARLSQRTFNRGASFHLAEAGLEEGLWTYNRLLAGQGDAWDGWQLSGEAAWRRFDGFPLAPATTGAIKVYASPAAPDEHARPTLVALASVQSPGGAPVTQLLEVSLRRRSFFASGLVARESLAFKGRNASFDSWDSDPDENAATPAVPYSAGVAVDTGEIATGAKSDADLDLNQARIFGYLRTNGLLPVVRSPGLIGPFGTSGGVIDFSRVGQDFINEFPVVTAPADGVFLASFGATLGTAGQTTSWRAPSLRLSGNKTLTIQGQVVLVLTDPLDALAITGSARIVVSAGSSLTLYFAGDVLVAGNGILNQNAAPAALQLWSTEPGLRRQRIQIAGGGGLSGVVYAPAADFTVFGNGEFFGALVAGRVSFGGNAAYHYDLALRRLVRHAPYRSSGWRTVDDPARRAALLPLVDR
jgi:hypothetical protein